MAGNPVELIRTDRDSANASVNQLIRAHRRAAGILSPPDQADIGNEDLPADANLEHSRIRHLERVVERADRPLVIDVSADDHCQVHAERNNGLKRLAFWRLKGVPQVLLVLIEIVGHQ